jgi:hypothetical protein
VAYLLRMGDLQAAFGAGGVSYRLLAGDPDHPTPTSRQALAASGLDGLSASLGATRQATIEQELVGARPASPVGTVPAETRINYLKGHADQWLTGLPTFQQLARTDAWPGVDVQYERGAAGLKSTYVVAPGGDPSQIQLAWRGARSRLTEDGSVELETRSDC